MRLKTLCVMVHPGCGRTMSLKRGCAVVIVPCMHSGTALTDGETDSEIDDGEDGEDGGEDENKGSNGSSGGGSGGSGGGGGTAYEARLRRRRQWAKTKDKWTGRIEGIMGLQLWKQHDQR